MPSIRSNIETSRFKKRARFVLPKRNGNELVRNRNRHGTRRFDSRYDERITRFTVISSHLTICRVFAVIKPRVSLTWIPFHVKRETYISWRIKPWQRLVMEYTGWICVCVRACIAVFVIPAWTGCIRNYRGTFRQPAVWIEAAEYRCKSVGFFLPSFLSFFLSFLTFIFRNTRISYFES